MATQGKGILGNPTGIIGEVNCYERKGTGILQSRTNAKDKYLRAWPLIQWRTMQRLSIIWDSMSGTSRASWSQQKPSGLTNEEWFYQYNLEYIKANEIQTTQGLTYIRLNDTQIEGATFQGRWIDRRFQILVPESNSWWTDPGSKNTQILWYKLDGTVVVNSSNFTGNIGDPIKWSFLPSVDSDYAFFVVRFRTISPTLDYGYIQSDIFNTENLPYNHY